MSKKDSFILYTDQKEVVFKLTDEEAWKLFKCIYEYIHSGKIPKLEYTLDLVFTPFRSTLDRDKVKYDEKCEILRKNASLGGQARAKQMLADGSDYYQFERDSDNVTESENDNESVGRKKIIKKKETTHSKFIDSEWLNDNEVY